jgi:hypothetical protein
MQANFPMEKRGYLYLAISFALFFLGDLIWLVNEIILKKIMPLGGIPDLLWSLAYFALITAIIYFISFSFRESNFWLYLILIVGIIAGGALLYSDIAEDLSEGAFDFAHAIQDSYIFYDLVLLILIIYLIWPMFRIKSRLMISWILLFVGVFIRLIYDYIFAEISENGTYFTGHWIDIIYIAFYVLIIFSNISKCKTLEVKNA